MDMKIITITLWDERKEGGAIMVVRNKKNKKEENEKEVNERCLECGHPVMIHFDTDDSHKKRCPVCGDVINLSKDVLWKYKCSCGKIIKPAKKEAIKPAKSNSPHSSYCPDS